VLQAADLVDLVLGQHLREHSVDAKLGSDHTSRCLVVAGDHRDLAGRGPSAR